MIFSRHTGNTIFRAWCLLSCVLAFSLHARAQETATLSVTVLDENRAAVAGATVEVYKTNCKCSSCSADEQPCKCCIAQATVTGDSGTASVSIPVGIYNVRVLASGFTAFVKENVGVSGGATNTVEIELKAAPPETTTPVAETAQTVSGKNKGASQRQSKEDEQTKVEGKVTDEKNRPLTNVAISFKAHDCRCDSCSPEQQPCGCCIPQVVKTNEAGIYTTTVRAGEYDLKIIQDGQSAGSINGLEFGADSSTVELNLRIEQQMGTMSTSP